MLKLVFFGTSEFAIPTFIALHKSKNKLLAVVTNSDSRSGRGMKNHATPIASIAASLNYPIYYSNYANEKSLKP